ncbi:MAG TPA: hypothetical protein VFD48_04825, partial [Pyrinomonadaceae bacterium]|nr:hypothetical protein [Pyrinomonadaceae bacterium]
PGARCDAAMKVWVRNTRAMMDPVTTTTSDRPNDGSSRSGFGSASPTARAPQETQPSLRVPSNLKPQQGQIVTSFTSNGKTLIAKNMTSGFCSTGFVY